MRATSQSTAETATAVRGSELAATATPPPDAARVASPLPSHAPPPPADLGPDATVDAECEYLARLVADLAAADSDEAKVDLLRSNVRVREYVDTCSLAPVMVDAATALGPAAAALVLTLPAIGQAHVLSVAPAGGPPALASAMADLVSFLAPVHQFYASIGGLAGYQLACLRLMPGGGGGGGGGRRGGAAATATTTTAAAAAITTRLHRPPGLDLSDASPEGRAAVAAAVAAGLAAGPALAEVLPLGGAGDRLGLVCPRTGDPLPAALLPFAGRTLLDGVVRDLQAREYLRWRVMGAAPAPPAGRWPGPGGGGGGGGSGARPPPPAAPTRCRPPPPTPVVVMTSDAKGNHARVEALLADAGWYGRGRDAFRLVRQPLVPLVAAEAAAADAAPGGQAPPPPPGRWLLGAPLAPEARPGGHGALWKLMADGGAFDWLRSAGRSAALVRQISNPLAGTDGTLLALAGVGMRRAAAAAAAADAAAAGHGAPPPARPGFGFVACPRRPGAAEGVVALRETQPAPAGGAGGGAAPSFGVTNVEYTEWGDGAGDAPPPDLPANTNVLFVGLAAAADAVAAASAAASAASAAPPSSAAAAVSAASPPAPSAALPGLVFNASKAAVAFADAAAGGARAAVRAGRLECTMQALADHLPATPAPAAAAPAAAASAAAAAPPSTTGHSAAPPDLEAVAAGLPTFAVHAARRQVTSSAKRAAPPGLDLTAAAPAAAAAAAQTPEGAYADAAANAADLLRSCGVALPAGAGGPGTAGTARSVAFDWHPALGPLWSVIAQKVRGGALAPGSELVLDVAEAVVTGLRLDGSLLVRADAPLGHWEAAAGGAGGGGGGGAGRAGGGGGGGGAPPRLVYSHRAGRVRLAGVTVTNAGVDWSAPGSQAWSRRLARPGGCARVTLRGQSEFDAADCVFAGDVAFDVPAGYKMSVRADARARDGLRRTLTRLPRAGEDEGGGRSPSWEWAARWGEGGAVVLDMVEGGARARARARGRAAAPAAPAAAPAAAPPSTEAGPRPRDAVRAPCDWSAATTSLDAFSHEDCGGSAPPWLDVRAGPVVLAPPVEAGAWEI